MATEAYDASFDAVAADATRGVAVGTLTGFTDDGQPLVDRPDAGATALVARSIVPLDDRSLGREVALLFEAGDPNRPIVIGVFTMPAVQGSDVEPTDPLPIEVEADGKRVVLTGADEVVLRCGKASIQLLKDGTIRLRGTNVLSRASGTNRIRGGNVQIN